VAAGGLPPPHVPYSLLASLLSVPCVLSSLRSFVADGAALQPAPAAPASAAEWTGGVLWTARVGAAAVEPGGGGAGGSSSAAESEGLANCDWLADVLGGGGVMAEWQAPD
jgi:hypothetical protein